MSKNLVKTRKSTRFGQGVIFGSKKIVFNNEGVAEVEDDILEEVLNGDKELELISGGNDEGDEKSKYRKELLVMKKEEILKLAADAELPESEYNTLNKDKLVDYLVSKIS